MDVHLGRLNPPQRQAVLHGDGPMLVLAGAGSGKTRVITTRIAYLLSRGVPARSICGMTFTNKAAAEMRQRLQALAGPAARKVTLSTFHALGLVILQQETAAAGLRSGFCVYDTADQLSLVRELLRQVKVADRRLDAAKVLDIILRTKRERLDEVALDWGDDYEMAAFDLYPRYMAQMRAYNAVDFDDLLLRTQDVLAEPDVRARWGARYEHLLVDEYQDTSPDQLALVQALAGDRQNICAVGDDDQAIYGWRGAAVGNILAFAKTFPGTYEVVLDQNYRSTGNILAAANAVIKLNTERKPKALWCDVGPGEAVEVVACAHDEDEAMFVAETVRQLNYEGVPYADVAVLYRANTQSRVFEETLTAEQIPVRVVGGQAFYDRKEVRDALALLGLVNNPTDELALRRIVNVPPRGIGPASLERLEGFAQAAGLGLWQAVQQAADVPNLPRAAQVGCQALVQQVTATQELLRATTTAAALPGTVARLLNALGWRESIVDADDATSIKTRRLDNLVAVQAALERFAERHPDADEPLSAFLRTTALARSPSDDAAETPCEVTLQTLHSAKGLEFPYVFFVGLEEDLLPHRRTLEGDGDLSEERRLCYVGMTRARTRLWLSHCETRQARGRSSERTPSRFLSDLPAGDGIRRWHREAPPESAESEDKAAEFFARMRLQLGIEEPAK